MEWLGVEPNGVVHLLVVVEGAEPGRLVDKTNRSGTWTAEPTTLAFDESVDVRAFALDSAGAVHVAWVAGAAGELWYATNASGTWATERIAAASFPIGIGLALDSRRRPSISFNEPSPSFGVRIATKVGDKWRQTSGPSGKSNGTSLAVDANDQLHLAFKRIRPGTGAGVRGTWELRYATKVGSAWNARLVDRIPWWTQVRLELDQRGEAHIAYYKEESDGTALLYATNATGSWGHKRVGRVAETDEPALAVDSQGRPHVIYNGPGGGAGTIFRYATKANGKWLTTSLPEPVSFGQGPRIGVDAEDRLHVAFRSWRAMRTEYVVRQ